MEQVTGQILSQYGHNRDYEHDIWNLNDQYCDFGSNQHIFEKNEIKNNTPASLGKEFYLNALTVQNEIFSSTFSDAFIRNC